MDFQYTHTALMGGMLWAVCSGLRSVGKQQLGTDAVHVHLMRQLAVWDLQWAYLCGLCSCSLDASALVQAVGGWKA